VIESRVLRGGSWINNQDNARADNRNHNHPDNRNNNIGFRVVCSSHIHLRPPECRQVPPVTAGGMRRRPMDGAGASSPHAAWRGVRAHIQDEAPPGCAAPRRFPVFIQLRPACRIQPPRSRPISAIMRLTCSYCPSDSQRPAVGQPQIEPELVQAAIGLGQPVAPRGAGSGRPEAARPDPARRPAVAR
jgi:hypothetical protein